MPLTPIANFDGGFVLSDTEKAELFKNHLAEIFPPYSNIQISEHTDLVNRNLHIPLLVSLSAKYFTSNDIKFAIQKYDLKKYFGYDLITAEVARCLPKRAIVLLTFILNAFLIISYFPLLW